MKRARAKPERERRLRKDWVLYARLPEVFRDRLRAASQRTYRPQQEIVRRALEAYLGPTPEWEEHLRKVANKWGPVYRARSEESKRVLTNSMAMLSQRIRSRTGS